MTMAQIILKQEIDETASSQLKFEEQYCRLCLSSDDIQFKQLFSPFNITQNIVEVIEDFAKVSILPNDEYSKLICCSCFIRLTENQKFKQLIESSDFKLRNQQTTAGNLLETDTVDHDDSDHENVDVKELDLKSELIIDDRDESTGNSEYDNIEIKQENSEVPDLIVNSELKQNLKVKKKRIRKEYQLKCPDCDMVFTRHVPFKKHLTTHSGVYPHHCPICKKGFVIKSELKVHEMTHVEEKNYQCERCGKRFKKIEYLKTHRKTHGDERPFKCDQCHKKYKTKHLLMLHKATHIPVEEKSSFVCQLCPKKYPTQFHLHNHVKRAHRKRDLITCDICGKSVTNYSDHIKVHTKPHKCIVCNQGFSNVKILKEHSTVHTGERSFECDVCKKTFGFSSALYNHKQLHDLTKRLKCEFCDKIFTYKHRWKAHLQKVHQKGNNDQLL